MVGDGCELVFGAVSTYGWYEFCGGCDVPCVMLWTSGSVGSRTGGKAASSASSSFTGLVRFGSSPALTAFSMRSAWYLAYLILDVISSSFFQTDRTSRNVAAARRVSVVLAVALFSVISLSPLTKVCRAKCSQYAFAATSSSKASSPGFEALASSSFSIKSVV